MAQQFGNELLKVNSHQSTLPDVHIKRSLFPYNVYSRLQSQIHGVIHPFYCDWVDPMTEKEIVCGAQVIADTQYRQVLDQIYDDVYWFYVPVRLVEKDWANILAGKNTEDPYDETEYTFKQFRFYNIAGEKNQSGFLLDYLGWKIADSSKLNPIPDSPSHEEITAYAILAYWKIYDEYFRDEKFDPAQFPNADAWITRSTGDNFPGGLSIGDTDFGEVDPFYCAVANKFHDYFTDAFDSPADLRESRITLGEDAPVGVIPSSTGQPAGNASLYMKVQDYTEGEFAQATVAGSQGTTIYGQPVIADTSDLGFTLQQLRLSLALSSLAITQQKYGSRYEEFMYGQFGAELPERIVRPVYLGGSRQSLANMPVVDSTGASLGFSRSTSFTNMTRIGFSKHLFPEHGFVIGVSVTRIAHSYNQGKNRRLWDLKIRNDLPLRQFMNLGQMVQKNSEIYNDPTDGKNDDAFGFVDSYQWEREKYSSVAGIFSFSNPVGGYADYDDLITKTSYQDIYDERPILSKEWLKESAVNVQRTMTGVSIPFAGDTSLTHGNPQYAYPSFIFKYYFKEDEIKAVPVEPDVDTLTTRW